MNKSFEGILIGIAMVVAMNLIYFGLTSTMSKPVKPTECSVVVTKEIVGDSLVTINKISCPEGNYRCFHTVEGRNCFKIEEKVMKEGINHE